jgi:hypothetical protein
MLGTVGNLQTINLIDLFNEYYHELMKYSKLLLFIFFKIRVKYYYFIELFW